MIQRGRTDVQDAGLPPARRRPRLGFSHNRRAKDAFAAATFMLPSLAGFTLFVIIPTMAAFALAFFDWNLFGSPRFVGLENFERLLHDPDAWRSLWVTMQFVLLGGVPVVLIGFMLAVLVDWKLRGVSAFRVLYFVPIIVSAPVSSVLWSSLYGDRGFLNGVLEVLGITGPHWLANPTWALPALSLMMIWLGLPLVIILYLAGMQRIPDSIYEAASIDGAGPWTKLWRITWPSVTSTTLLVGLVVFLGFVAGGFEIALIMTNGGPLLSTQSLSLYAYKMVFERGDVGYGSVLSAFQLMLFLVPAVIGRIVTSRRRES